MNASPCEYFMQLRMQQLEMTALELNFAFVARAIKLPALSQVKAAWQCIFKIHTHTHNYCLALAAYVDCAAHTHFEFSL